MKRKKYVTHHITKIVNNATFNDDCGDFSEEITCTMDNLLTDLRDENPGQLIDIKYTITPFGNSAYLLTALIIWSEERYVGKEELRHIVSCFDAVDNLCKNEGR